jgi:hypothetical protein
MIELLINIGVGLLWMAAFFLVVVIIASIVVFSFNRPWVAGPFIFIPLAYFIGKVWRDQ